MKIDSTPNPSPLAPTGNGAARAQSGAASSTSAPAADAGSTGDTTVNLSGLSGQLRSASASGSADIDTALVQSIKDALNNGTLTIDVNKIADGVLNTARDLLQQQRSQGN
ncbi:flagellar biosynthesis anti-sigma factor FlgM [Burkholderia latens]|uniref:Negative regulator of flagellin synthesis n=1 Tax=Burkholderia latens TaxID=488446 RepID=A0A6H9T4N0_9BURK|nr:flagellar biosynthesis anti-sigma factor FlgM [Burkholderia latens]KAB0634475.1 flagellar biosynthesis anti-sigma factor FlgM [Burkholderia latens]VWC10859.1 flagellar biosynthesis protein FlgM [Burkholderia latens]